MRNAIFMVIFSIVILLAQISIAQTGEKTVMLKSSVGQTVSGISTSINVLHIAGLFTPLDRTAEDNEMRDVSNLPASMNIENISPNPFNTSTAIEFYIPEPGYAKLDIVDITGHTVATLLDGDVKSENYVSVWNAKNVPSGVYFARLKWNGKCVMKKILLTK